MKYLNLLLLLMILAGVSCTSTKNLTYLQNLTKTQDVEYFPYSKQDYKVQHRDILYIDVKTLTSEGKLENVLRESGAAGQNYIQGEASQYLIGYSVDKEGRITLPVLGDIHVGGLTLEAIRDTVQAKVDSVFNHAFVEVKLLSFKYTVLGEARSPGTFVNFNDYLTVLEAIGRAGGIGDYGRRDNVLVVRGTKEGTQTYRINLQDKNLLTSEAYFLMPNDVVIIEPVKHKIFNMNLPTISFSISTITGIISTTLLLINYFGK